jgi:hypothetical protein
MRLLQVMEPSSIFSQRFRGPHASQYVYMEEL